MKKIKSLVGFFNLRLFNLASGFIAFLPVLLIFAGFFLMLFISGYFIFVCK